MEKDHRRSSHKKLRGLSATFASLLVAACGSGQGLNTSPDTQTPSPKPASTDVLGAQTGPNLTLAFPIDNGYFLGGPHSDGLSNGTRYAVDFGAKEIVGCPGGSPLTDVAVTASESGKVIHVGNENDLTDKYHSIVEVQDNSGFIVGYMHLDNLGVMVGQNVNTGDFLGNPSCEIPPGGNTSGVHVHEYLKDKNGNSIPIEGTIFEGFTLKSLPKNYDGLLVNGNDIRTADKRRCGPSQSSIDSCGGVRNDLFPLGPTAETSPTPSADLESFPEMYNNSELNDPLLAVEQQVFYEFAQTWNREYTYKYNSSDINDKSHNNDDSVIYANTSATNLEEWYNAEKNNLFNTPTQTPINIRFDISRVNEVYSKDYEQFVRYIGELEINNIDFSSQDQSFYLTSADRANGISWEGSGYIDYIQRFRIVDYFTDCDDFVWNCPNLSKRSVDKFIKSTPSDPLPDFSPWENAGTNRLGFDLDFKIINGQIAMQPIFPISGPEISPWSLHSYQNLYIPTEVTFPLDPSISCSYGNEACSFILK